MNQFVKIFLSVLFLTTLVSCDEFLDVNQNPNSPGSATLPLSSKLSAALVATVNLETGTINQVGAFWGGYWGTNNDGINQFLDLKTFNGPEIRHQRDGILIWENTFNAMLYYKLIQQEAELKDARFYAGVSKIMLGWHFLRLVDIYNGVPFDDALTNTLSPAYEDGKTVYEKAMALISAGISDLKNTPAGSEAGADDVVFKGNTLSWIKFANTIKLRALIRQSEVSSQSSYIASQIQLIQQEGSGFLGKGESALIQPGYLETSGKLNPFWENYYRNLQGVSTSNREMIRPTVYLIDQYKLRNDPRLANLYTTVDGEYKGVLFGNPETLPNFERIATSAFKGPLENDGKPAAIFKRYNQPSVLMGSYESLFLQAEAVQRGWLPGSAKGLYEQAIQDSFAYMEVPASAFAAYNAQATVNFDQAVDKIERIIGQKWLALNSISSIEAWNDYRRTGFPDFPNSLNAPTPTSRPLRFMYPESERMTNNEQTNRMGSDETLKDPVWWDQ